MTYYTWDNYSVCIATGVNQLTAWRNADVKLATGECITPDSWLMASCRKPHEVTSRQGRAGAFVHGRYGSSMIDGLLRSTHKFQTAQFCYWLMQACTTTENTPAGYNTHAITINASTTPLNFGFHLQSKGGDDLLWDCLGLLPQRLTITCSEMVREARQIIEIPYAYINTASDDFTKTQRAEGTTGTIPKTWDHCYGNITFTYNAGSTECDIIGFTITLERDVSFHTRDGNGYATIGLMGAFNYSIRLDVIPTGNALFDLSQVKKSAYAGDLDLTIVCSADATNDKITFAFDKLYMIPTSMDKNMSYSQNAETYSLQLEPYDHTSSLTVTGIDSLNNDHYENP